MGCTSSRDMPSRNRTPVQEIAESSVRSHERPESSTARARSGAYRDNQSESQRQEFLTTYWANQERARQRTILGNHGPIPQKLQEWQEEQLEIFVNKEATWDKELNSGDAKKAKEKFLSEHNNELIKRLEKHKRANPFR